MSSSNSLQPIGTESVVEKIIQSLLTAINAGDFPRGSRLPGELELTKKLAVSRNSLREAIKFLTAMGILEVKRGDGTFVSSEPKPAMFDSIIYTFMFESSTNEEIIELRQALDDIVLRIGIQKCSDENIDQLDKLIDEMQAAFRDNNISLAARKDYEFHMYLIECSKNPFLIRIVKGVYSLFEHSIEFNIRSEKEFANAVEHHQEIVKCLRSRDELSVTPTVNKSLSSWRKNAHHNQPESDVVAEK